jgi:hypothetical protein
MAKLAVGDAEKFNVTREMAAKVLDACIDNQWRLVFALARFGGLRCPSEILHLRWGDVDWDRGRVTVHSPKTEHHEGKASRTIPLFPELRPHLEAVWDEAAPGTEFVITRYRRTNANLSTQMKRIIRAAGLEPWRALFNSLRSTRQTELTEEYPAHVVCAWLGNSVKVAAKHYLQVTDAHFQAAAAPTNGDAPSTPVESNPAPNAVQSRVSGARRSVYDVRSERENAENLASSRKSRRSKAPPVGLEPTTQRLTAACSTN